MKTPIIFILLLSVALTNQAQSTDFLRLYDKSGKKFTKGKLIGTTDSTLILKKENNSFEVPIEFIGYIRTNRSTGHNILISSLIAGGVAAGIAIIGNSHSSHSSTTSTGYLSGLSFKSYWGSTEINPAVAFLGSAASLGAPIGAIIGATKKKERYMVNGDREEWKKVKAILDMKILKTSTKNKKV